MRSQNLDQNNRLGNHDHNWLTHTKPFFLIVVSTLVSRIPFESSTRNLQKDRIDC